MFNFYQEYKLVVQRHCISYTCWTLGYVVSRALSIAFGFQEPTQDIFGAVGIYSFAWWAFAFVVIFPAVVTYFKKIDRL